MKLKLTILFIMLGLFGCKTQHPSLKTVDQVDLNQYAGTWYDIASFPARFQKGCHCTTAEYQLTGKDYIRVINTCRKDSANGKINQAKAKAWPVKGSNNSRLKVQFFWPFKGDYWIIALADDYSWAAVGNKSRKYLWILSRTPEMQEETYQMILKKVKNKGFDTSKLVKTDQSCYY